MKKYILFAVLLVSITSPHLCFANSVVSFTDATVQQAEFLHEVSSCNTTFGTDTKQYNRNYNIALAADAINGIILNPNETFSFNDVVLTKTLNGQLFKEAGVLLDGKPAVGVGGGICQVSTTLFAASVYAGMNIVERHPHSARVGYVAAGRDATVAFSGIDLKIRNPYSIPIKIETSVSNGNLLVRLLSQHPIQTNGIKVWSGYNSNEQVYTLTRSINGIIDYITYSKYKN